MNQSHSSHLVHLLSGSAVVITLWMAGGSTLAHLGITDHGWLNDAAAAPPDHAGGGGGGGGGYGSGARDGTGPGRPDGPGYGGPGDGSGSMLNDRVFHSDGARPYGDVPPGQHDALTDARVLLDPGFTPISGEPAPQLTVGAYQRALITGNVPDQPTLENLASHLAPATAGPISATTVTELNEKLGVTAQFGNTGIDPEALAARVNQLVQERDGGPCTTC